MGLPDIVHQMAHRRNFPCDHQVLVLLLFVTGAYIIPQFYFQSKSFPVYSKMSLRDVPGMRLATSYMVCIGSSRRPFGC